VPNALHLLYYVPFVKLRVLFQENTVYSEDPLHYLCWSSIGRQKHRRGSSSQVNIFEETEEGSVPFWVSSLSVLFVNLPFSLSKWPLARAVACVSRKTNAFMRKVTFQVLKTFFHRILCFYFFLSFLVWPLLPTHCRWEGYHCAWSHSVTHTQCDSPGLEISPLQRPLSDDTQHSQETGIHVPSGIRTRNPSKRTAADQRLGTAQLMESSHRIRKKNCVMI
jgi:hypothetical protein